MARWERWLPAAWSVVLAVLLLGPALGPGFLLSYDMVWVPDLALRADSFGLGPALPRAVPADAVVAVLDEVVPGMVLQKLVLLASLVGAGAGAAALAGRLPVAARCAAASVAVWNPYVVERLLLGHWTMLVAYAALPWALLWAHRLHVTGRVPAALLVLVPASSLSPSAGLMVGAVVLVTALRPGTVLRTTALVAAANAPWVVSGLLHTASATSDARAAELFALRGAFLPAPLEALALGGVWNGEVVPASRDTPLALLGLAALAVLAACGAGRWWRGTGGRLRAALLVTWAGGMALALLTWAAPAATGWLAEHLPGGGLLRDGSRLLGLGSPLLAVLVGHGVARVTSWLAVRWQRGLVAVSLACLPVTFLPDAGWGAGLPEPASYPESWAQARPVVGPEAGRVVVLPFASYRAPAWNGRAKVLNPAGRYFPAAMATSDELAVDGTVLAGEDPEARRVAAALRADTPQQRAAGLLAAGIGRVLVERDLQAAVPEVAGEVVLRNEALELLDLGTPSHRDDPPAWRATMAAAWAAYLGVLGLGAVLAVLRRRRR